MTHALLSPQRHALTPSELVAAASWQASSLHSSTMMRTATARRASGEVGMLLSHQAPARADKVGKRHEPYTRIPTSRVSSEATMGSVRCQRMPEISMHAAEPSPAMDAWALENAGSTITATEECETLYCKGTTIKLSTGW